MTFDYAQGNPNWLPWTTIKYRTVNSWGTCSEWTYLTSSKYGGVGLKRSSRISRPTISSDYVVYLQEFDFDVVHKDDPKLFSQVMSRDNSTLWFNAVKEEINSWLKPIVLLIRKALIYYHETFSSMSKNGSFDIIMALTTHFDIEVHQIDVKITLMNMDLK